MSYLPFPYIVSSTRRVGHKVIVILFSAGENESRRVAAGKARAHLYRGQRLRHRSTDTFAGGTMFTYVIV